MSSAFSLSSLSAENIALTIMLLALRSLVAKPPPPP